MARGCFLSHGDYFLSLKAQHELMLIVNEK